MSSKYLYDKLDGLEIDILDLTFTVEFEKNLVGRWGTPGQIGFHLVNTIYLDPEVTDQELLSVLVHEILEGILKRFNIEVPHHVISSLEVGFYNLLLNNPDLVDLYAHRSIEQDVEDTTTDIADRIREILNEKEKDKGPTSCGIQEKMSATLVPTCTRSCSE